MSLPLVFSNTRVPTAYFSAGNFNTSTTTYTVTALSPSDYFFNGTINQVGDAVTATSSAGGSGTPMYATSYDDAGHLLLNTNADGTGQYYAISTSPYTRSQTVTFTETQLGDYQVTCYCTGTLIRTARGEVAVEDLQVGDLAVTAFGEHRPIRWIGHRSLDLRQCPDQAAVQPFKIAKDAFAPGRPERDLFVSPGHLICVDVLGEVLIPAFCLANGSTVQQVERDSVTYWHVELDSHDILVAEGLPAESYLEADDRSFFGKNGQSPALGSAASGRCRPFARDGALVELVRERLSERAELLGWQKSSDMDIHLKIDGVRVEPACADGLVRFLVPKHARDVRLMSAWYQPSWGRIPDNRHLGIAVSGIRLSDGLLFDREIAPADEWLRDGFYPVESHENWSWRWTTGCAKLPRELWAGANGDVFLTVAFNSAASQRWIEPGEASQAEEIEALDNVIRLRA